MKRLTGAVRVGVIAAFMVGLAGGLFLLLAIAGAIDTGGSLDGINVMVDGEHVDTVWLALGVGGAAVLGIFVATLVVMAVFLGLALVLPLILAAALFAVAFGLVAAVFGIAIGLAPLVVPVLLMLGLYALLRRKRARPEAPQ